MAKQKQGLIDLAKNLGNKVVTGATKGEVLENFSLHYVTVQLTIATNEGAVIALKKGATIGSGDTVSAVSGKYPVTIGSYNYSIALAGHFTATGVINITLDDAKAEAKTVALPLVKYCVVTFNKTPAGLTLVVKQGATTIDAEGDGTYKLAAGAYTWTASADDYTTKEDEALTISAGDVTTGTKAVTVTLESAL